MLFEKAHEVHVILQLRPVDDEQPSYADPLPYGLPLRFEIALTKITVPQATVHKAPPTGIDGGQAGRVDAECGDSGEPEQPVAVLTLVDDIPRVRQHLEIAREPANLGLCEVEDE